MPKPSVWNNLLLACLLMVVVNFVGRVICENEVKNAAPDMQQ